jgi:uncharacterized protein (TIGR02246 family)
MKGKWLGIVAASLAAFAAGVLFAQEKTKEAGDAPPRPDDVAAVRAASQNLARTFEKGDAKAFAALWTEEGEYMDEDNPPVRGRAALEKAYAEFFAKRAEMKVESKTNAVRFLGKDLALEEGTFTVHSTSGPPNSNRFSAMFVRQDGRWQVALLKEWNDETANKSKLEDLAWMIGAWKSEGSGIAAETKYEWAENKKFIRGKYTITNQKDKTLSSGGTQVIGVDPASGVIRSWTFDAEGGLGEASWAWNGDRWVIDSAGTLHDGTTTTATNLLQRQGDNSFTWRSVQRTHEGEKLPDLPPVQVKRMEN